MTQQSNHRGSYWDILLQVFRPDRRSHEQRIREALKIVPKPPAPVPGNHY